MSTISPNMSLIIPTVGTTVGPDWAQDLNASLASIDGHDHASGQGVPINPSGLNINSDLSFQGNQATNLSAISFTAQASVATLNAMYVKGVDLYYRDGSNNEVQITTGGTVNATSSGISSGTATASFVSSVLVVNAASTTPADIRGGSILLGNNSAGSHFLTLSPPSAMSADYSLTLPSQAAIPASTSFMTLDSSGNMSTGPTVLGALTTSNLSASAGITKSQLAAVGQQISSTCGNFSTSSTSPVDVTNLSVTISVTGTRPVWVGLIQDQTPNLGGVGCSGTSTAIGCAIRFLRGSTTISNQFITTTDGSSGGAQSISVPNSSFSCIDFPGAGANTYKVQLQCILSATAAAVDNAKLLAYEIS